MYDLHLLNLYRLSLFQTAINALNLRVVDIPLVDEAVRRRVSTAFGSQTKVSLISM